MKAPDRSPSGTITQHNMRMPNTAQQKDESISQRRLPNLETMLLAYRVDEFIQRIEKNLDFSAKFEAKFNFRGEPRIYCNEPGSEIRLLLKAGGATLRQRYPGEIFSPRVVLFSKLAMKHGLESLQDADLVDTVNVVNGIAARLMVFSKELCDRAKSPKHQRRVRHHTRASRKNFRGACYLVDHLFRTHKRGLRVIRLDLSYKRATRHCEFDRPLTVKEVFEHRAILIKEFPTLIHNDALVAYICRTEFKPAKGFHHHLIIFLDASRIRQDVTVARAIGEHFVHAITDQRGLYQNINAEYLWRQDEPTTYVGLILPGDLHRIECLKQIGVDYVCKHDYLIRWIMPPGHRAFSRTEVKEKSGPPALSLRRLAHSVS